MAADVTVAWDPNDPSPEGYRVFMRQSASVYDYTQPAWEGAGTRAIISDLSEGSTYGFVVRAFAGELESADSDEVVYTPPVQQRVIVYPKQPQSILITFGE